MKLFLLRLITCYNILTQKHKHWLIINLTEDNIKKLLLQEDFETISYYHKLQPYLITKMIKNIAEQKNEVDVLEERLKFELKAEQVN